MWLVPLEALTEDQLNAVQMSRQTNQVIIGGPGSGKTLALIHRAHRHLADGVDPERIKILVYTNVLVDYLQSSVKELGMKSELVSTFDSWCLGVFSTYVKGPRPRTPDGKGMDYEAIRVKALEAIESKDIKPWLDSVLVDEGQDLSPAAINLLRRASSHVTLALDTNQQLYQESLSIEDVCAALNIKRASAMLLSAYRCTPLIVDIAATFLPDVASADSFKRSNLLPVAGVETPVLKEFDSQEAEFDALAMLLNERALLGQESAVLLPSKYLAKKYAEEMTKRNLTVTTQKELQFGNLVPMFMTYHSAKGLTVDSVFLPGLTENNFSAIKSTASRKTMLFVGITRASHWVWLGTQPEDELNELAVMPELERVGSIKRSVLVAKQEEIVPEVEEVDESQSRSQITFTRNPRVIRASAPRNSDGSAPRRIPVKKASAGSYSSSRPAPRPTAKKAAPAKKATSTSGSVPPRKAAPAKKAIPVKKATIAPKPIKNPDDLLDLL